MMQAKTRYRNKLLLFQSLYYLVTALWPLFHITSFMAVTGHKTDVWLVKTVSMLILCVSLAFLLDLYRREASSGIVLLAVSCTVGFIAIDLYYNFSGVIREIYLADALIQLFFLCFWLSQMIRGKQEMNN
ncbi:MAG: hypothetical protein ACO1O6_01220 [Bacteroidota bacterium]